MHMNGLRVLQRIGDVIIILSSVVRPLARVTCILRPCHDTVVLQIVNRPKSCHLCSDVRLIF